MRQKVAISISTKLPPADKTPPFTTWIFLDRNQGMADDQLLGGDASTVTKIEVKLSSIVTVRKRLLNQRKRNFNIIL
ncbi:unnamed protein product [Lactuca virosa]|uniref:Uncharacterized protein n=1 Tax=Lactuca virosa TaxID=75947 RepID=A0AAU9M1E5_9ASTR|nr:unnamed protein product [Lactuca virosa]